MPRRRRHRDAPRELTLQLGSLAELFAPPRLDEHGGGANLVSGVERLVIHLQSLPFEHHPRIVVLVPSRDLSHDTEERVRASLARYCDERAEYLRRTREVQVRDGISALGIGLPLLLGGLLLIEAIRRGGFPDVVTSYFGDGLILVLAWVAVWYPLDALLYYGRSAHRERHAVERLRELEVIVRAADGPVTDG
jgi:hypothetical protein